MNKQLAPKPTPGPIRGTVTQPAVTNEHAKIPNTVTESKAVSDSPIKGTGPAGKKGV